MGLATETKQEVISKYGKSKTNTGASEVQIALMTERLTMLNQHFQKHVKDHHSKRGLLQLVGKRRRLLRYLEAKNPSAYKKLVADLGIRS